LPQHLSAAYRKKTASAEFERYKRGKMRIVTITILIAILMLIPIAGATESIPTIKTDVDCVPLIGYIVEHKNVLNEDELRQFLLAFSNEQCLENVEFSEFGNGVLFSLIELNPQLLFQTLFSLNPDQIEAVKYHINNPVDDSINVIKKYETIKNSNMPSDLKRRSLNFMQESYENQKKMIDDWERKNNKKWEYSQPK
jgi:hypothetical protein